MTLSDLLALLRHGLAAGGPALDRLPERTVGALATAYLSRRIGLTHDHPDADGWPTLTAIRRAMGATPHAARMLRHQLDLTDPGTAHAVLVALALSYGHDPGPLGLDVALRRDDDGWTLYTASAWEYGGGGDEIGLLHIPADQPAAAIAAMVAHRLAA